MTNSKILSYCCNFEVRSHKSPLGEYCWCPWCGIGLTPDGKKECNHFGYNPMHDIEYAFSLIKEATYFKSLHAGVSQRQMLMAQRQAFYEGAKFREIVTNVSGNGFIHHEAMLRYPFPNGEPNSLINTRD